VCVCVCVCVRVCVCVCVCVNFEAVAFLALKKRVFYFGANKNVGAKARGVRKKLLLHDLWSNYLYSIMARYGLSV